MTNITDFLNQFKRNAEKAKTASNKTIQAVIAELYTEIVNKTPVGKPSIWKFPYVPKGYIPGTLKKSWEVKYNGINVTDGIIATISNDQPYAERVETGWSSQAPYGMMRTSILNFATLVDAKSGTYRLL